MRRVDEAVLDNVHVVRKVARMITSHYISVDGTDMSEGAKWEALKPRIAKTLLTETSHLRTEWNRAKVKLQGEIALLQRKIETG